MKKVAENLVLLDEYPLADSLNQVDGFDSSLMVDGKS